MAETQTRAEPPAAGRAAASSDSALDQLRRILVQPEHQTRLQAVEERLEQTVTPESVANVLPDAAVKARKTGSELDWALAPIVVQSFREAAREDPAIVMDIVFPAIGPAIRKAVSEAIQGMVERFNAALERTLSIQSLRWRLEAARTGRPFGEIVMLHTLVYRVEQVFLVHRESGLALQHVVAEEVPRQDADQVAGMLSAIESFAHDAFDADSRLGRFVVGDLVCLVEHSPHVLLAAVIRGIAPESLREQLSRTLERIQLEYGDELRSFKGDAAPFAKSEPILRDLLQSRQERRHPARPAIRALTKTLFVAALVAVLTLWGLRVAKAHAEDLRFASQLAALRSEPGFVVTSAGHRHGRYDFAGLRDPVAARPEAVLARARVPSSAAHFSFAPFYSRDARLLAPHVREALDPPPTVTLTVADTTATATGSASRRWIEEANTRALGVPGLRRIDTSGVVEDPICRK